MTTKADRVKAALDQCYTWYEKLDCNIRTLSERIDALWHEVDYYVEEWSRRSARAMKRRQASAWIA